MLSLQLRHCTTAACPHSLLISRPLFSFSPPPKKRMFNYQKIQSTSCAIQWMSHRAHLRLSRRDQWSIGSLIWIVWQNRRSKQSSKIPSRIEKFVTESVRKGCHKRLLRLIAQRRPKVQVPAAHFNLNLHPFVPDSSSSMIWLWGWAATTGHCAVICLTKVILCFKGQVTDTNRRLQDAGRGVR